MHTWSGKNITPEAEASFQIDSFIMDSHTEAEVEIDAELVFIWFVH